jgi:hypothetical protein
VLDAFQRLDGADLEHC